MHENYERIGKTAWAEVNLVLGTSEHLAHCPTDITNLRRRSLTSTDCTVLRFSTRKLSPSQRLPAWYEIFCHSASRRYCTPREDTCHVDMRIWRLGPPDASDLRVQRVETTDGLRTQRTKKLLSDGNDDLVLNIQEDGATNVQQSGREATAAAGMAVLTSNADASAISFPASTRFTSIALPRRLVMGLAPSAEDALVRPTQVTSPVVPMLLRYIEMIDATGALRAADLRRTAVTHIHDLCALIIGASRDAAEIAGGRGLRAARLQALKADIARHLTDGEVSATALARRHRITPRYVHRLFESEGITLSRFVRTSRLARVHRNLTSPLHVEQPISSLAYEAGFGDLSTFNHEFRRHYGATPSDVRAAIRQTER
jgi:AraC-like DNA-binding protein